MPGSIFAAVIVLTAGILTATDKIARAEAPLRLDYEVYGGGAHALDLNLRLVTTASGAESGDYTVAFQARTAGWVARLFPFVLESRAEGRLREGAPAPRGFATANRWDDKDIRIGAAVAGEGGVGDSLRRGARAPHGVAPGWGRRVTGHGPWCRAAGAGWE